MVTFHGPRGVVPHSWDNPYSGLYYPLYNQHHSVQKLFWGNTKGIIWWSLESADFRTGAVIHLPVERSMWSRTGLEASWTGLEASWTRLHDGRPDYAGQALHSTQEKHGGKWTKRTHGSRV